MSPHKERVAGRPFLGTRLSPDGLCGSDTSQRVREGEDRTPGSSNMFRALRRHTAPELRLHFGEESDLQELLFEDEDDGEGEDEGAADTD